MGADTIAARRYLSSRPRHKAARAGSVRRGAEVDIGTTLRFGNMGFSDPAG